MRRWTAVVAMTAVVALLSGTLAQADEALADGDGLTPVSTQAVVFGNVCANTTVTKDVLFALTRSTSGNPNIFKNSTGAVVSVVVGAGTGSGLSAAVPPLVAGANFTIPTTWQTSPGGTVSPAITSPVTLVAGAAGSSLNRTLVYSIAGTNANNGAITRDVSMTATASVVSCDTTPPTLSLPSNQTVEATGPAGRTVTFVATATDTNPASPVVTCAPASGSTFALGTTTVACSSADAAGNVASGSFSVTVQDTTGPAIGAVADLTSEATGPSGATVSYTSPSATDLVDGARPVSCLPASGSTFPLGPNDVTCSASDTRGNLSTRSFSITVTDTGAPTLVLPGTITAQATSVAGASVDFSAAVAATDTVDGDIAPLCAPAAGSTFALGSTPVDCVATDGSGNAAVGSFAVVVEDTTAPALTVPPSFTEEATSASGATVDFTATASDLVDGSVVPTCAPDSGSTFPIGETTVLCAAVDQAGNANSAEFTVTVVDTTAPELTLPADVIAEADELGGKTVIFLPTAVDAVDGAVTVTCLPASGSLFPVGSTTVTCSAEDAHGNQAMADLNVTITDTTAPVVTASDDLTLEATGPGGAVADFAAEVSAADVVDGPVAVSCDPASGATFPLGVTTVTCAASDEAGNEGTAQFDVTVVDTTGPTISGTPDDFYVEATSAAGAIVTFTNPTALDLVDGGLLVDCVPASGGTFPLDAVTVVTCTATDAAGNPSSSSFEVFVSDTTSPILALPSDITEEATGPDGAVVTYAATATDDVDPDVPATCVPPSGTTFALGTTPVACSATDDHGNVSSGGFQVSVVDTTAPDLVLPADITAEATSAAGASVSFTVSAVDLVSGAVAVTCTPPSGSTFGLGVTEVDCAASDAAGNEATGSFTITVEDTTAPALDLPADIVAEATSASGATVAFTATASDLVDGTVLVTCTPAAGVFPLGATTVDCVASDASSNVAEGSFLVTVQDTTAPDVSTPGDLIAEATSALGAPVTFAVSSTDAVDGSGVPTCDPTSASVFALGSTVVTCQITDAAGNTGSGTFSVTVEDTTGPTISDTPSSLVQEATSASGAVVNYSNPAAVDLVDGVVPVTCVPPSGSTFALDVVTTVTCTSSDARGNTSESQFEVTVSDTAGPLLTVPSSFTVEATAPAGASVPFTTSASDVVDGVVAVTCDPASGSTFGFGPTTVDCSASDAHTNTSSASFTVTVEDTTPPVLTLPSNITIEATGPSGASASWSASALDLVDGALVPSCDRASGSTFALGTTTVTCSAADAHTNTASGSFTVTVRDTTAPTLTLPSPISATATGASGAAVTYVATATDVVAGTVAVTCAPPSGSTFAPGVQVVSCVATDGYANSASGTFTVTVLFDLTGGFLQPVSPSALNTVKGGSTVPLKFQVRTASGGYINSLTIISGFVLTQVQCGSLTTAIAEVDFTTTGGTTLSYDSPSNQFHQNWKTPKQPGTCYRVDVVFTGGLQRLSASFQLK